MPEIVLTGIEFYGYHGVPDTERAVGHRFLVDLELSLDTSATTTDELTDTADYGAIALTVIEVGKGPSVKTVERLAQLIAEAVLERTPRSISVTVEVHKLLPPIPATVASAGFRLTLSR